MGGAGRSTPLSHPQAWVPARAACTKRVAPGRVGLGGDGQQRSGEGAQRPWRGHTAAAVAGRARRVRIAALLPGAATSAEPRRGARIDCGRPPSGLRMAGVTTPGGLRMLITPIGAALRKVIKAARGTLGMVMDG